MTLEEYQKLQRITRDFCRRAYVNFNPVWLEVGRYEGSRSSMSVKGRRPMSYHELEKLMEEVFKLWYFQPSRIILDKSIDEMAKFYRFKRNPKYDESRN